MKLNHSLLALSFFVFQLTIAQKTVAITIDDVPNTRLYQKDGYSSKLMARLDSLEIPIAIFINEGLLYRTDSITKNFDLLRQWAQRDYITLGNHSFNHPRYSEMGIKAFADEIVKGEAITRELAKKNNKSLDYFRFPFNDIGQDSLQHVQVRQYLKDKGYVLTPHTVESSDWMFSSVYEHYLDQKDFAKAKEIGETYLATTLAYFDFFERMAQTKYQRPIQQIYLCHDNPLNADYLPKLVAALKERGYTMVGLGEALQDPVYAQKDEYYKKWGVSWLYRWMPSQEERVPWMKQEPSTAPIQELFEALQEK